MKKIIVTFLLSIASVSINAEEQRHASAHVHGLNNVEVLLSNNQLNVTYKMPIVQLNATHDDHEEHHEDGLFAFITDLFSHDDHDEHNEEHHNDHDEHHNDHEEHEGHDEKHHDEHENHDDKRHNQEKLAEFKDNTELFVLSSNANCHIADFDAELHSVSTESNHKDVELTYKFDCSNSDKLNSIEFTAFKHFELDAIFVEAIINHHAISKKITSTDSKMAW
ncbi:MAG: DUF2796 domain-containing protein [Candidatus Thioglobus sp.]|uniref:ZrgA family zinc uptake protein n=1 Tax=Candidatus Thioglobus sp. TaxID=2026721 RepID=UPI002637C9FC|nr:DUF2796 domain-containing protein [Candidatus Thioglobus sp.]MDC9726529.1 DUF2796 domain-containing protein [Candidatus Thioglobus sp.]